MEIGEWRWPGGEGAKDFLQKWEDGLWDTHCFVWGWLGTRIYVTHNRWEIQGCTHGRQMTPDVTTPLY